MLRPFLLSGMKSSRAYEKKTTSATGMQKDNSYRSSYMAILTNVSVMHTIHSGKEIYS